MALGSSRSLHAALVRQHCLKGWAALPRAMHIAAGRIAEISFQKRKKPSNLTWNEYSSSLQGWIFNRLKIKLIQIGSLYMQTQNNSFLKQSKERLPHFLILFSRTKALVKFTSIHEWMQPQKSFQQVIHPEKFNCSLNRVTHMTERNPCLHCNFCLPAYHLPQEPLLEQLPQPARGQLQHPGCQCCDWIMHLK